MDYVLKLINYSIVNIILVGGAMWWFYGFETFDFEIFNKYTMEIIAKISNHICKSKNNPYNEI